MSTSFDFVVVGAGIVGLSVIRELLGRHPGARIAVVDKEFRPGRHQSGHNSGVLHAGVYYKPGSLKARLCVEGKVAMEQFADQHGVHYEACGKLIVATGQDELGRLVDLLGRAEANGVTGARLVGPAEMREIEPHVGGIRALHVPGTGIIDFGEVVGVLTSLLRAQGVAFYFGHEVVGLRADGPMTVVQTSANELRCRRLITCAGLHADRLARLDPAASGAVDLAIVPFRGDYYTLRPDVRHLCRGLIYPVPDPSLPFLGVHFTKRVDGAVWAGPNAVLAAAREGYRRRDVNPADLAETVRYPGFRKLARRYWRTGAAEIWRDFVKAAFVHQLQRYVPEVRAADLTFGPAGVRAQAVGQDGRLVDDFKLVATRTSLHVLNAPSPAATASLAIARRIADQADKVFDLPRDRAAADPLPIS